MTSMESSGHLSPQARRLLEVLVDFMGLPSFGAANPWSFPTYDRVYHMVVPSAPKIVRFVGHNLRKKGLDGLDSWTLAHGSLPRVTGLIVNASDSRPSDSYFTSHGRNPDDDGWWLEQMRRCYVFDWSPFVGSQQADSPAEIAEDTISDDLAPRVLATVSRIVRDGEVVRRVKAWHAHTCQICSERLELSPGRFYSEGHHLKPLGKPHNGPDKTNNVVCVCPTCHVKLDYAVLRIDTKTLRRVPEHRVADKYVAFHNARCAG